MKLNELEQEYYSNLGKYAIAHAFDDFDDIFLFGLRFYASLCKSLAKTEELEFTVKGEECKELFAAFYTPLVRAMPFERVRMSLECEFLVLLKERELSKVEVQRLYAFYIVLCHSFYGDKNVMQSNLQYIFELAHSFCSVNALGELNCFYEMGVGILNNL